MFIYDTICSEFDYKRRHIMRRIKLLLLGFATSLLSGFILFPLSHALAQSGRYSDWHMGPGMMGSWGMGGFGMIFMMVFWVLAIVGLVFLVKWLVQAGTGQKGKVDNNSSGAIEILKERYARGEIDKAEFETRRELL
jgi:putative membrane protein